MGSSGQTSCTESPNNWRHSQRLRCILFYTRSTSSLYTDHIFVRSPSFWLCTPAGRVAVPEFLASEEEDASVRFHTFFDLHLRLSVLHGGGVPPASENSVLFIVTICPVLDLLAQM